MGLCPKSFGPYFWGAFHLACLAVVDKDALRIFIETYQMVLPCYACRYHFAKLLVENPLPDIDQFKWSVDIHNMVNKNIGKPEVLYEDALKHWLSGCEPEVEKPEPFFDETTTLLTLLLLALIFALAMKNRR